MSALWVLNYIVDDFGNRIEAHELNHSSYTCRYYYFNAR